MDEYIAAELTKTIAVLKDVQGDEKICTLIAVAAHICITALRMGNKIMLIGNGGSAADAQHLAAEFVGRFQAKRDALPAIALTTDSSILTAVANDFGFETVFARQVSALGREGDVLIAISTSGSSPNIIAALDEADRRGVATIGLTGGSGGIMATRCMPLCICMPSSETSKIQEAHIVVGHIICGLVERELEDEMTCETTD